jgi:hypothetical protein
VAPAEIIFAGRATPEDPVRVLKRNYLGVASAYNLDYFALEPRNRNLDNVNNHITAGWVALTAGGRGLSVAMDTSVQSNFAFAPLKMACDPHSGTFQVRVNPFGTYHGRQYRMPTWGNGLGYDVTLHTGEQFASAGPTYNGAEQEFALLIGFFQGQEIPPALQQAMRAFAHPPWVVSATAPRFSRPTIAPLSASLAPRLHAPVDTSGRPARPDVPLGLQLRVLWANLAVRWSEPGL